MLRVLKSNSLSCYINILYHRLLFGSDFPFVQQQVRQLADVLARSDESSVLCREKSSSPGKQIIDDEEEEFEEPYVSYVRAPLMWPECRREFSPEQWGNMMGGTAEKLYGHFDVWKAVYLHFGGTHYPTLLFMIAYSHKLYIAIDKWLEITSQLLLFHRY